MATRITVAARTRSIFVFLTTLCVIISLSAANSKHQSKYTLLASNKHGHRLGSHSLTSNDIYIDDERHAMLGDQPKAMHNMDMLAPESGSGEEDDDEEDYEDELPTFSSPPSSTTTTTTSSSTTSISRTTTTTPAAITDISDLGLIGNSVNKNRNKPEGNTLPVPSLPKLPSRGAANDLESGSGDEEDPDREEDYDDELPTFSSPPSSTSTSSSTTTTTTSSSITSTTSTPKSTSTTPATVINSINLGPIGNSVNKNRNKLEGNTLPVPSLPKSPPRGATDGLDDDLDSSGDGSEGDDEDFVLPSLYTPSPKPETTSHSVITTGHDGGNTFGNDVSILGHKNDDRLASFFAQPGILAAVIGGAVVGLLCAILLVMFIVYRMRKKDEGSYTLDEPKRSPTAYSRANSKEFYA